METAILFGQAMVNGMSKVVEIISSNKKTVTVRQTYNGVPYGKTFKRHIRKHCVRVHGINVVRNDYMSGRA